MALPTQDTEINKSFDLPVLLIQQVETNRDELTGLYLRSLRANLFTARTEMHPREVKSIAVEEVEALLHFLWAPDSPDLGRGSRLCELGLREQSVLGLAQVTRQFFITHLEHEMITPALEILGVYQTAVIRGFMQSREKVILNEQDRLRQAFELTIRRYTVEIKEIQELAQRATEANEFRSRFIARISHELRTPLGAIMGMSEMLQHTVYGPLTPQQRDITQRIVNNVHSLERIFSEFLDQSQIETGQLHLKDADFSPQALAQLVYTNYLPMALQKGLALHLQVDPDLPRVLFGDNKRIEQILNNLVLNAIKFTETGSIEIYINKDGPKHWTLQVQDTGVGVPKEAQAYIFEPFRQADETTGRKHDGVGLGLAIVQQLVTAMNGQISLDSKIGQGSTFTVTIPLRMTKDEAS